MPGAAVYRAHFPANRACLYLRPTTSRLRVLRILRKPIQVFHERVVAEKAGSLRLASLSQGHRFDLPLRDQLIQLRSRDAEDLDGGRNTQPFRAQILRLI